MNLYLVLCSIALVSIVIDPRLVFHFCNRVPLLKM